MNTETKSLALRVLATITGLLCAATIVVVCMQPGQHALLSGMPALLGSAVCFSIAALNVFSGSFVTGLGQEIKRSAHPIMFWTVTLLLLLAGVRCLFLV